MRTIADLRSKTTQQLHDELAAKRELLVEQKRSRAAGELANPHAVKKTRREIAAILTLLNEQPSSEIANNNDEEKK